MAMRFLRPWLVILGALAPSACHGPAPSAPSASASVANVDTELVARRLAAQLATEIAKESHGSRSFEVGVTPFGNKEGRVTPGIGNFAKVFQFQLTTALRLAADGRFTVITPTQLAARLKTLAPVDVNFADTRATAAAARKMSLGALVVGNFEFNSAEDIDPADQAQINASAVFAEGDFQTVGEPQPAPVSDVNQTAGSGTSLPTTPASLAKVRVSVGGRALPVKRCKASSACRGADGVSYRDTLFLALAPSLKGQEYAIDVQRFDDDQALIGAAVAVDGVSSFYKEGAPQVVLPAKSRQWLLAPRGKFIVCQPDRSFILQADPQGVGHARIQVKGFQKDQTALAFTFGEAGDSPAHLTGVTSDVGLITVHFFKDRFARYDAWNRDLSGVIVPESGTEPGREIHSAVCLVRFTPENVAKTAVKILYRYTTEALPIADAELETLE